MSYPAAPSDVGTNRVRPDSGQFWAGGVATAVVAALIALVGILVCRWTLGIPILAPAGDGAWGDAHTGEYVLVAACVALVATALLYLLVLGTPQPGIFFRWIMALATLAAVVYPFSTAAPVNQKGATAVVNLVLGIAITSLLTAVAARAIRRPVPPGQPVQPGQPGQPVQPGRTTTRTGYDAGYPADPNAGYVPGQRGDQPTQPVNVPPQDPGPRRW
jgi:hypothetical protein